MKLQYITGITQILLQTYADYVYIQITIIKYN